MKKNYLHLLIFLLLVSLAPSLLRAGDKKAVAVGNMHVMVLKQDGSLWTFGRAGDGQLGYRDDTYKHETPEKIMGDVVQVSAYGNSSMALKQDGSLWAWGDNERGQLGIGSSGYRPDSHVPTKILDNVAYVWCGDSQSWAIDRDGNLWGWGQNGHGQLCDGTKTDRLSPVKRFRNIRHVSVGRDETLVVDNYGDLYQLKIAGDKPRRVMAGVSKTAAGYSAHMILKEDGTLWMYGSGKDGLFGDGDASYHTVYSPEDAVKVMSGVRDIAMGNRHAMAIKNDGSLWAWGWNEYGQLGDGTKVSRSTPVKVDDNVQSVACGYGISAWITDDGELRLVGEPF